MEFSNDRFSGFKGKKNQLWISGMRDLFVPFMDPPRPEKNYPWRRSSEYHWFFMPRNPCNTENRASRSFFRRL